MKKLLLLLVLTAMLLPWPAQATFIRHVPDKACEHISALEFFIFLPFRDHLAPEPPQALKLIISDHSGGQGKPNKPFRPFKPNKPKANPVPEPATLFLLCAGIGALALYGRKRI